MAAVKAAFDFLRSNYISTSCADPCEMPKPAERHSIRKITSNQFFIVFGEEIGEIKGVGAERLVRLCRERHVDVEVLAGELPGIAAGGSVVSQDELPTTQGVARISEAEEIGRHDVRRLRKHLNQAREDIELQLLAETSAEEREQLEAKLSQVKVKQNALQRIPDSDVRRMRDSVERSLRRLEEELRKKKMPLFSAYTAKCWKFDELANRYRHLDIDGINWDFADF
jgi:hypothetical protein